MSVIGSNILAGASGGAVAGYEISRSLRFNDADTSFLGRTPSSASSGNTKLTYSVWVKGANAADKTPILSASSSGGSESIEHRNDGTLVVFFDEFVDGAYTTSAVFRDLSAWYHFVFSIDTTLSTAADRVKIYVNGVQVSTTASPALTQNFSFTGFNQQGKIQYIGRTANTSGGQHHYADAYYADIHMIDGQALDPTDFGEYDNNNVWQPKEYEGTFGTNGYHLDFSDNSSSAALGTDSSGNSNTWTVSNLDGPSTAFSTTVWTSSDSTWTIASGGGSATMSSGGYADVFSGLMQTSNVYAFTTSWSNGDTNGGWFFSDSNSTSLSGTHPNEGRGSNSVGQRGGTSALGSKGTFASANGVGDGTSNITGFSDTNPAGSDSLTWVVDRNNHKVWVSHDGGSSWVKGGNPFDTSTTPSFSLPSTGDVYFGFIQNTQMTSALSITSYNLESDSFIDTPTDYVAASGNNGGNYATLNPLGTSSASAPTNGNLEQVINVNGGGSAGTIAATSGKWYWEVTGTHTGNDAGAVGILRSEYADSNSITSTGGLYYYNYNGNKFIDGTSSTYGATWNGVGNTYTIGVALDLDGGTVTFYKNNAGQGSISLPSASHGWVPHNTHGSGTGSFDVVCNFGQRAFAYTAPSGFKALCTTNLDDPTIADGSTAMDVKTYTGNGGSQSITTAFSPDFVWFKARSDAYSHSLFDIVRGVQKRIKSNSSDAEATDSTALTAFNSDGFTVSGSSSTNLNNDTYVAWTWDGGTSTVSNTDGSVTTSVRANASTGFSIVTFNSGSSDGDFTCGHGLNAAPELIIMKSRSRSGGPWWVYHADATNATTKYLQLSETAAVVTNSGGNIWGSSLPTSSVFGFSVGAGKAHTQSETVVSYCFAPVEGYSAFGSYTGNGSADGPFVYTGFRPRWVMVKVSSTTNSWVIIDSERDSYNIAGQRLRADLSNAEDTQDAVDFLSNGFKVRSATASAWNDSGQTYIYACFCEHPFKTARAR